MKLKFDDIVGAADHKAGLRPAFDEHGITDEYWIAREILSSATKEILDKAKGNRTIELKLLLNGKEVEPKLLSRLFQDIVNHIDTEAKKLATDRMDDLETEFIDLIREGTDKLKEKYVNLGKIDDIED